MATGLRLLVGNTKANGKMPLYLAGIRFLLSPYPPRHYWRSLFTYQGARSL